MKTACAARHVSRFARRSESGSSCDSLYVRNARPFRFAMGEKSDGSFEHGPFSCPWPAMNTAFRAALSSVGVALTLAATFFYYKDALQSLQWISYLYAVTSACWLSRDLAACWLSPWGLLLGNAFFLSLCRVQTVLLRGRSTQKPPSRAGFGGICC